MRISPRLLLIRGRSLYSCFRLLCAIKLSCAYELARQPRAEYCFPTLGDALPEERPDSIERSGG